MTLFGVVPSNATLIGCVDSGSGLYELFGAGGGDPTPYSSRLLNQRVSFIKDINIIAPF